MVKAIITDIEGTTTDIHFVHKVLFPYSKQRLAAYVSQYQDAANLQPVLQQVRQELHSPSASVDHIIQQLLQWIDEDKKIAPLKTLQGFIWQSGFENGDFKSHIYADAYENLIRWHQDNITLYVYSSGSVQAQQLLFQYTPYGDLRYLFTGYFDTQVGGKKEVQSYANILQRINLEGSQAVFLSDVIAELDAARDNQIHTMWLNRDKQLIDNHGHQEVASFDEIQIKELT